MSRKSRFNLWSRSLCWTCAKSIPTGEDDCPWVTDFSPVDGWDAIPKKVGRLDTYEVKACPLFADDSKQRPLCDEDSPYQRLAGAVAETAVKDYIEAATALMKKHEKYVEAFEKTKDFNKFSSYAISLHNKYKLRGKSRFWDDWWKEMPVFVTAARARYTKKMRPYLNMVNDYHQRMRILWDVEQFMLSQDWMVYTDADGERTLKLICEQIGFDKSRYTIKQ